MMLGLSDQQQLQAPQQVKDRHSSGNFKSTAGHDTSIFNDDDFHSAVTDINDIESYLDQFPDDDNDRLSDDNFDSTISKDMKNSREVGKAVEVFSAQSPSKRNSDSKFGFISKCSTPSTLKRQSASNHGIKVDLSHRQKDVKIRSSQLLQWALRQADNDEDQLEIVEDSINDLNQQSQLIQYNEKIKALEDHISEVETSLYEQKSLLKSEQSQRQKLQKEKKLLEDQVQDLQEEVYRLLAINTKLGRERVFDGQCGNLQKSRHDNVDSDSNADGYYWGKVERVNRQTQTDADGDNLNNSVHLLQRINELEKELSQLHIERAQMHKAPIELNADPSSTTDSLIDRPQSASVYEQDFSQLQKDIQSEFKVYLRTSFQRKFLARNKYKTKYITFNLMNNYLMWSSKSMTADGKSVASKKVLQIDHISLDQSVFKFHCAMGIIFVEFVNSNDAELWKAYYHQTRCD
ncbi:hypothetical protein MP228_003770 [Amoeboaphelidium protococcarum]|nr:hypothetical protein MP228_003770 [Amoeboaphelidium protococcarum]